MSRLPIRSARLLTTAALLSVCLLLQGCLVATVAGAAADVGGAVVGGVVKGTVAVGKAVIPLAEPGAKGRAQAQP
jgi:hypothetical protein